MRNDKKTETLAIIFLFCFWNVKVVNREKLAAVCARSRYLHADVSRWNTT